MSGLVLITLLIADNAGQVSLLWQFTRAGAGQSAFQLCTIKETMSSFDYTVTLFDFNQFSFSSV